MCFSAYVRFVNRIRLRSDDLRVHTVCFQHNVECWDGNLCIVTEFIACFKDEDLGGGCHNNVESTPVPESELWQK